jgi:hypothetical protein
MTRIICAAALREKLHDLGAPLELCNGSGNVLARVVTVPGAEIRESAEPQISGDELDRRIASRGRTYTTAGVLAHLESL